MILAMLMLVSIISPFGQIGFAHAQINPDVQLTCEHTVYEFEQFVWDSSVGENVTVVCSLENPTLYNETINIQVTSAGLAHAAPNQVELGPGENESFEVDIVPAFSPNTPSTRQVTISARVDQADGAPCPTCTSQTTSILVAATWGGTYIKTEFNNTVHQGEFILELLSNEAPLHEENFVGHAYDGNYNGTIFHRVIEDFVIQGGDFENGDGTGGHAWRYHCLCNGADTSPPGPSGPLGCIGPGSVPCDETNWTLPDEHDNGLNHVPYAIGMAKTAFPDTAGSQFYILNNNSFPHLDGIHTVFGHVIEGFDEIEYIHAVATDSFDRPVDDVIITGMEIVEWPIQEEPDSDGDGVPDSEDAFPNDENETADSDGDGTGDNADAFPNDENETHDDDGDGTGNNSDAFPQDGNETHDDDGDGVGNNSDAFPQDENETMDTDGDGVGDNSDADPDDPDVRFPADIQINVTDNSIYVLAFAILIFTAAMVFVRRRPPPAASTPFVTEGDSIWNDA